MGRKCTVTNTVHKYQYHQIYEFYLFKKKKRDTNKYQLIKTHVKKEVVKNSFA